MTNLISMMIGGDYTIIPQAVRDIVEPVLLIIMCLLSIAMIVIVMKQSGDPENLGAITGGNSESYYSKNKGKSRDEIFKKATIWISISLLVISIVYFILKLI